MHYSMAEGAMDSPSPLRAISPRRHPGGFARFGDRSRRPQWAGMDAKQVHGRSGESAKHGRCVVLASGWYEWPDKGRGTNPRYYYRSSGGLLGVAGLWTRNNATRLDNFAIIGTAVNPTSTFIHNRTPVVLREEHYGLWLNTAVSGQAFLVQALSVYEPPDLAYRRVGPYIDDAAHDSEKCIERLPEP